MPHSRDTVAVVGAGIFGITAAVELRARGYEVAVFDPGPVPRPEAASTDISKCVRMDYGDDALYTGLAASTLPLWRRWNGRWGETVYHETGFLFLTRDPMEPGSFEHDSYENLRGRGVPVERWSPQDIAARHPVFAPGSYQDGYFNPHGGWAASARVVALLAGEAAARGVRMHAGTAFTELRQQGSRVAGIVTADGRIHGAQHVLVAAGAWTPTLLPHLQPVLQAVAQPVLHFQAPDPPAWQPPRLTTWAYDLSRLGWYGFPALPDGTLKIAHHGTGTTVHPDDPRAAPAGVEEPFLRFVDEVLPALAASPILDRHLCLYCDSFDGDFWIDRDPDRPGLVVAAGGSGHGFKFAPLLGGLIADALEGKDNLHGARFRWRPRGPARREKARAST